MNGAGVLPSERIVRQYLDNGSRNHSGNSALGVDDHRGAGAQRGLSAADGREFHSGVGRAVDPGCVGWRRDTAGGRDGWGDDF